MKYKTNEMLPVRLKGVGDGLTITLDPLQPFELLRQNVGKIFERLGHLTINAKVVIDTGDEYAHEELVQNMEKYLKDTFTVGHVSGSSPKRSPSKERIRQRDIKRSWEHYNSDVLMLAGRVRSGQKVNTKKHLIIMGDVNPGAEIIAGGDILVMGRLSGTALAGQPDNEEAIILALDFCPSLVQIGSFVGAGSGTYKRESAEVARVENGVVVVDDYLKANPFGRLPWPEIR